MDIRSFNKASDFSNIKGTVPSAMPVANDSLAARDDSQGINSTSEHTDPPVAGLQDEELSGDKIIEGYIEYLKEHDISKEDIFKVLDTIITAGEVFWQFELLGKLPVVFKMRPAWVNEKLVAKIEEEQPKTFARFSDMVSMFNLAGSLVSYKDTNFELSTEEDLERNIKFIMQLPFIIQNRLVKQMAIFDRVIAVATSDWAVENFTEPLSEE